MADPFIGEIIMFGGNFAPRGWAFCDGQLLAISSHSALFSILGTTYGGDGRTTFGLPDMRGRVPIHPGNGPGLSDYRLGQKGGRELVTLSVANLPSHSHDLKGENTEANAINPTSAVLANGETYKANGTPNAIMKAGSIGNTGGSQPFDIRQPYLCVNFIIALVGVYPSRN